MKKPILCITLHQPWASLIALGAKRYETRSWKTPYRGTLIIHAGRVHNLDAFREDLRIAYRPPFRAYLEKAGITVVTALPRGAALCVVDLVDCIPTEFADVTDQERAFGDFTPGRFAWKLENLRVFADPYIIRGAQGLWPWPFESLLDFKKSEVMP